jgi:hypothetical protein
MSEWCQNKKCPEKKNQNQIRGSKGAKYYQSNKAHTYYYDMFCSQGCFHSYFNEHQETIRNAVGIIDKQVLPLEDAWYVEYKWGHNVDEPNRYHLRNKLKGIDRVITKQQAQTLEQIAEEYSDWQTIDTTQAKELAITLGLAS